MTDLRNLIETRWEKLTPNHLRIADYILSHPFRVATMGIEDLAEATTVSVPTITRFVRFLGLTNYAEFRKIAISRNLDRLSTGISAETAGSLVNRMVRAEQVGMLGLGSSAGYMGYLHELTEPFLRHQFLLDGTGGHERMACLIGRMGSRDLLIAMTLPHHSAATVEFMRLARASGVPCIGLSDSDTTSFAGLCDQSILLPAAHPVLNSSGVASIAFFEAIAALLTARHDHTTRSATMARPIFLYPYTGDASSAPPPKEPQ
ncbi:MurR/RpiR family transcriptional regulator [Paracoccus sp. JM45]|uniref:MurR/RpiR family transcriptional regulator n=1 Tax=Paracoccus sp. JM45 TaxID=2283626 RepID=UPI000E6BF427|nr:MurR/RpiR family transcriptional regulator [Paracoccus sp. JM45]RJE79692.1 MurR/RpiR family transcriptional regulator [Paracoccus sp. JM45]